MERPSDARDAERERERASEIHSNVDNVSFNPWQKKCIPIIDLAASLACKGLLQEINVRAKRRNDPTILLPRNMGTLVLVHLPSAHSF